MGEKSTFLPRRRFSMFRWLTAPVHEVTSAATDLLFPPACSNCPAGMESPPDGVLLCPDCRGALLNQPHARCQRCAMPVPEALVANPDCEDCRRRKPRFHAARTLGMYGGALREAVLKTKHLEHEPLAVALAKALA